MNKEVAPRADIRSAKTPTEINELGDLLAAFGNNERKAALLAAMHPEKIYSSSGLNGLLPLSKRSKKEIYSAKSWCRDALAPVGLVAKEIINIDLQTYGYGKTELGMTKGDALSGHLLEFSETHPDTDLFTLLGTTQSSHKRKGENVNHNERMRAPLTRVQMFYEILTANMPLSQRELVEGLLETYPELRDSDQSTLRSKLKSHLDTMNVKGVVQYDYPKEGKPFIYERDENSPKIEVRKSGRVSLRQAVRTIVYSGQLEEITSKSVAEVFEKEYKDRTPPNLINQVAVALTRMSEQGELRKSKFGYKHRTEITVTDQQRETLTDFVNIIDAFAQGGSDFLREGRKKAERIVKDEKRLEKLVRKAENASPYLQRHTRELTARRISDYLVDNPGCSKEDLRQYLADKYGQKLGPTGLDLVMTQLAKNGTVEAYNDSGTKRFSTPKDKNTL